MEFTPFAFFSEKKQNFESEIEKLATNRSSQEFFNRKDLGKKVLLHFFKELNKESGSEVRLFIKNLHQDLFDYSLLVDEIYEYLKNSNNKFWILLEERDITQELDDHKLSFANLIRLFIKKKIPNLSVKILKDSILIKNYLQNQLDGGIHFITSSNGMYRLEIDEVTGKAKCCYNGPVKAKDLSGTFDIIFKDNHRVISFDKTLLSVTV